MTYKEFFLKRTQQIAEENALPLKDGSMEKIFAEAMKDLKPVCFEHEDAFVIQSQNIESGYGPSIRIFDDGIEVLALHGEHTDYGDSAIFIPYEILYPKVVNSIFAGVQSSLIEELDETLKTNSETNNPQTQVSDFEVG